MTETGGEVGLVRVLPGVAPELVGALVHALEELNAGFTAFSAQLEAGSVHEQAFGRLVDAAKVRDAYHDRLPATRTNLTEAGEVAASFLAEFAAPPSPVPPQREAQE